MKYITILLLVFFVTTVTAQSNIDYMTSGGKLKPLQANMDIRHYTLSLDVDIQKSLPKKRIKPFTAILILFILLMQPVLKQAGKPLKLNTTANLR